ncbi:MAG: NfeD family protein [Acidimicrobiia bacterium]
MDALLDAPAFVIVALTLASALLLVEAALPTFGLAGLSGLALGVGGLVAVGRQGEAWWPLAFLAFAVCLWAVLLVRRSAPRRSQLAASGLYVMGGVGYGIGARDPAAIAVAAIATLGLSAGFPPLFAATSRLLDGPAQMGMEALIGRLAMVERSEGTKGTVRLDGSLWTATADPGFVSIPQPGAAVTVTGSEGMVLRVGPGASSSSSAQF